MKNYILKYRVQNFKLLKDVPLIEIKPLTFLFGPNGSGKSSFISSILLFRQFILPEKDYYYSAELNSDFSFGEYKDIVSFHDDKERICFEFVLGGAEELKGFAKIFYNPDPGEKRPNFSHNLYELPEKLGVKLYFEKNAERKDLMNLIAWEIDDHSSGFNYYFEDTNHPQKIGNLKLGRISKKEVNENADKDGLKEIILNSTTEEIEALDKAFSFAFQFVEDIRRILDKGQEVENETFYSNDNLIKKNKYQIVNKIRSIFSDQTLNEYDILSKEIRDIRNIFTLINFSDKMIGPYYNYIISCLKNSFRVIQHLKNIRFEFPRGFSKGDKKNTDDENIIIDNLISVANDKSKLKLLNKILVRLNLGDKFILTTKEGISNGFVLKDGVKINIADMSSGFKQIFPIILKILSSRDRDIFLLEQPELHLHPKLQTDFILALANKEHGFLGHKRFIIETHSEHMIRKVQTMIAKSEIKKEDVAVYYFGNNEVAAQVRKLELEDNGFFKEPWPDGFFDESYNLTKELLRANKN